MLAHTLDTDPGRFWVATQMAGASPENGPEAPVTPTGERLLAYTSATVRARTWFLAMLFVLPGEQARGLGSALLARVLPRPGEADVRATCTDSAQPISNALYARLGIVPRLPILELVGRPDREPLPPLPDGVRAVPFEVLAGPEWSAGPTRLAAALAAVDKATLGYSHPADHAFLHRTRRLGYLYEGAGGEMLGYGYTSEVGRIGPLALVDPELTAPALGHLLGAVTPAGAFAAWVPGSNDRAIVALLRAGLRLEDFPALLCWDHPFGSFDRYIPISLAVL
jgi:GNAT superfamily N-acetyltransferase